MTSQAANFVRAILQGLTGVGLFRRLHYPGQSEEFLGTETADEVTQSPAFQHLARTWVAEREHAVETRQLTEYYAELYRMDNHEHTHEGTCPTY